MQCSASIDQLAEMSLQDIIAVQAGQPLPEVMDAMQALAQTIAQKDDAIAKMEAGLATVQERQRGHIGCLEEQVAMLQKTLEGYNERNGDGAETMPAAVQAATAQLMQQRAAQRQKKFELEREFDVQRDTVSVQIIRHARTHSVCKYQSCMF